MAAPRTQSDRPRRRRRWFQYSLRMLMALMTLSAVGLGLYHGYVKPYRQQHEAGLALVQKGAALEWRPLEPPWLCRLIQILAGKDVPRDCVTVKAEHCGLEDKDLEALRHMPRLERLYLARNGIGDAGLAHLRGLKRLERLSLWGTEITDDGLAHLSGLRSLQVLDIQDMVRRPYTSPLQHLPWTSEPIACASPLLPAVSRRCLKHLRNLKDLRELHFYFPIDDEGLAILGGLPKLRFECLFLEGVTEKGLAELPRLRSVQGIIGLNVSLGDDGLRHFGAMKGLQRLWLESPQTTGDGWRHLRSLTSIEVLSLRRAPLNDGDLQHLAGLAQLEGLSLAHTPIGDDGVAHLAGLRNLRQLDLRGTQATADCLEHLVELSRLRTLAFRAPLDDEAVRSLARMTRLNPFWGDDLDEPYDLYLTDAGLFELPELRCIPYVNLHDACDGIELPGIDAPDRSATMTDAGLVHLQEGHHFRRMSISGRKVTLRTVRWNREECPCEYVEFRSPRLLSEVIVPPWGEDVEALEFDNGGTLTIGLDQRIGAVPCRIRVVAQGSALDLSLLRCTPRLRWLKFPATFRSDWRADWENLRFVPGLEEFTTDSSCVDFAPVDARGIHWLGAMKNLRKLSLRLADGVQADDLTPLAQLTSLQDLDLNCDRYSADHLAFLASLANLRKLRIFAPPRSVDDEHGLRCIERLEHLDELWLSGISDAAMPHIAAVTSLQRVSLTGRGITDAGSRYLDRLPNLMYIDARQTAITDERLAELENRPRQIYVRTDR